MSLPQAFAAWKKFSAVNTSSSELLSRYAGDTSLPPQELTLLQQCSLADKALQKARHTPDAAPLARQILSLLAASATQRHTLSPAETFHLQLLQGQACQALNSFAAAKKHFAAALQVRPADPQAALELRRCRNCLSLPRFELTYARLCRNFYVSAREVLSHIAKLCAEPDSEAVTYALWLCFGKLHALLQQVLPVPCFSLAEHEGKLQLYLSAQGNEASWLKILYLCDNAPQELQQLCALQAGLPPEADCTVPCQEVLLQPGNVRCRVTLLPERSCQVRLQLGASLPEEQTALQALPQLTELARRVLGEKLFMAHVAEVSVLPQESLQTASALSSLPELLQQALRLQGESAEHCSLQTWCQLKAVPCTLPGLMVQAQDTQPVPEGTTCLIQLQDEFTAGSTLTYDRLQEHGVCAAVLALQAPADRQPELLQGLEQSLQQGSPAAVTVTGSMYSKKGKKGWACLEVLAWDLPQVLQSANAFVLHTPELAGLTFRVYRKDSRSILLLSHVRQDKERPAAGLLPSTATVQPVQAQEAEAASPAPAARPRTAPARTPKIRAENSRQYSQAQEAQPAEAAQPAPAAASEQEADSQEQAAELLEYMLGTVQDMPLGFGCALSDAPLSLQDLAALLARQYGSELAIRQDGPCLQISSGDCQAALGLTSEVNAVRAYIEESMRNSDWAGARKALSSCRTVLLLSCSMPGISEPVPAQYSKALLLGTKILSCLCTLPDLTALHFGSANWTDPQTFADNAAVMQEGKLPVYNWLSFYHFSRKKGMCGYTRGLSAVLGAEIEVTDSFATYTEVCNFMAEAAEQLLRSPCRPEYGTLLHIPYCQVMQEYPLREITAEFGKGRAYQFRLHGQTAVQPTEDTAAFSVQPDTPLSTQLHQELLAENPQEQGDSKEETQPHLQQATDLQLQSKELTEDSQTLPAVSAALSDTAQAQQETEHSAGATLQAEEAAASADTASADTMQEHTAPAELTVQDQGAQEAVIDSSTAMNPDLEQLSFNASGSVLIKGRGFNFRNMCQKSMSRWKLEIKPLSASRSNTQYEASDGPCQAVLTFYEQRKDPATRSFLNQLQDLSPEEAEPVRQALLSHQSTLEVEVFCTDSTLSEREAFVSTQLMCSKLLSACCYQPKVVAVHHGNTGLFEPRAYLAALKGAGEGRLPVKNWFKFKTAATAEGICCSAVPVMRCSFLPYETVTSQVPEEELRAFMQQAMGVILRQEPLPGPGSVLTLPAAEGTRSYPVTLSQGVLQQSQTLKISYIPVPEHIQQGKDAHSAEPAAQAAPAFIPCLQGKAMLQPSAGMPFSLKQLSQDLRADWQHEIFVQYFAAPHSPWLAAATSDCHACVSVSEADSSTVLVKVRARRREDSRPYVLVQALQLYARLMLSICRQQAVQTVQSDSLPPLAARTWTEQVRAQLNRQQLPLSACFGISIRHPADSAGNAEDSTASVLSEVYTQGLSSWGVPELKAKGDATWSDLQLQTFMQDMLRRTLLQSDFAPCTEPYLSVTTELDSLGELKALIIQEAKQACDSRRGQAACSAAVYLHSHELNLTPVYDRLAACPEVLTDASLLPYGVLSVRSGTCRATVYLTTQAGSLQELAAQPVNARSAASFTEPSSLQYGACLQICAQNAEEQLTPASFGRLLQLMLYVQEAALQCAGPQATAVVQGSCGLFAPAQWLKYLQQSRHQADSTAAVPAVMYALCSLTCKERSGRNNFLSKNFISLMLRDLELLDTDLSADAALELFAAVFAAELRSDSFLQAGDTITLQHIQAAGTYRIADSDGVMFYGRYLRLDRQEETDAKTPLAETDLASFPALPENAGQHQLLHGVVLLQHASWDMHKLCAQLRQYWHMEDIQQNAEAELVCIRQGKLTAFLQLQAQPSPDGLRCGKELQQENPLLARACMQHQARLQLTVCLPQDAEETLRFEGLWLASEILFCCALQKEALLVNLTSGIWREKNSFVQQMQQTSGADNPLCSRLIQNWVDFRIMRYQHRFRVNTCGMKLFSRPELALEWTALPLETIKELMSKTAINLLHNTDFVHKVMTQAALELTLQAAQGSLRMLVRPRPQCNPAVLDLQVAAADPIRAEAQSSQSPQADSTESARSASAAGQSAGKLSPDLLAAAALCGSAARTTGRAQQQATAEAAAATGTADSAETDSDAAADSADNAAESTCAGTAELRKKSVLPASSKNRQFKLSLTPEEWFGSDNCQFFAPGTEAQEIEQAWQEAVAAGKAQGFVPVLVRAGTDRGLTFMQQLLRSFSRYQDVQPDPAVPLSADSLRHAVVQAATLQALPDGRELMQHLCSRLKKNVQTLHLDPQLIWPRSIKAQARSRTLSLQTAGQEQILLIKIRVAEPWQVLAFVPYEDSEHIHTLAQVLSAGKFWYDKYRAVPVLAGEGVTEFMVPRLIPRKWAPDLAEQILAWCGTYTAAHCADRKEPFSGQSVTAMLQASTVWQLHWLFR